MGETSVQSLGQEDPQEEGMATHPCNLAWRIPWTEKPGRLQYIGLQRVGFDWVTNIFTENIIFLGLWDSAFIETLSKHPNKIISNKMLNILAGT